MSVSEDRGLDAASWDAASVRAAEPPVPSRRTRSAPAQYGRRRARGTPWLLVLVLIAQAVLSARLLWMNTAFEDEGEYLWLGHWELMHLSAGTQIPSAVTWFSGAPTIYPVIGAVAADVGGLVAARVLSMAFMLGATVLLYLMTSRLFSRNAGLAAAAVFAALGPVQRLGAFATYDAMALFLLALASWLVVRGQGQAAERWLVLAAIVLAAANATKYASALWDPVVAGLALLTAPPAGVVRAALRAGRLTLYTIVLEGALLALGGKGYLQGVMFSTLARHPGGVAISSVLYSSAVWIGAAIVLGVAAITLSFADTVRTRLLCVLLTVAALLAPQHQAQIHTLTSLSKHVAFGAWFAGAAAGYALARAMPVRPRIGWLAPVAVIAATATAGISQATAIFHSWPSSASVAPVMRNLIGRAGCPCLASQSEVLQFYLTARPYAITGPFYFVYRDPATDREYSGLPAYEAAIRSHYFKVVEVDPYESPAQFDAVTSALAETPGYRLVGLLPEGGPGSAPAQIWSLLPGGSSPGNWP